MSCSSSSGSPPPETRGTGGGAASGGSDGVGGTAGTGSPRGGTGGVESIEGAAGEGGAAGFAGIGEAGQPGEAFAEPLLDDLAITGARLPVNPAFDSEHFRYSIVPQDPPQKLAVTATADRSLTISVNGVNATSGAMVGLPDLQPGSEFVIEVSNAAGESQTYTLLYLPTTFPEFQVTVREPGASQDPLYLSPVGDGRFIVKLDNYGVPILYRAFGSLVYDFKKHPSGELSYAQRNGETRIDQVVMNDQLEEIERVNTVGLSETNEHDFRILPNGDFIVMAYETSIRDLTPFGGPQDGAVIDAVFQELSPEREVLFEWSTWDHVQYDESLNSNSSDYVHANSVFVDTDGNWLISMRAMSQVIKVDRETGEVIWRLGGVSGDFTFQDDPFEGLCGQHNVTRLQNGHLLLFDNGTLCYPDMPNRGNLTRVVEYALDEQALTATLVWSYSHQNVFSKAMGSAQRLSNDNTLIGWGWTSSSHVMVTEVDPAGDIVFELEASDADGSRPLSYRAKRFAD